MPRFTSVWKSASFVTGLVAAIAIPLSMSAVASASAQPLQVRGAPTFDTSAPAALPGVVAYDGGDVEPTHYIPQTSCETKTWSGIAWFKKQVLSLGGADWGVYRTCGSDVSEHYDGRAFDWGIDPATPTQVAKAAGLLTWLMADNGLAARRLGIMYFGWKGCFYGTYRASEGCRPLSAGDQHNDHVHFSFTWRGANGQVSARGSAVQAEDYGPCKVYKNQPAPGYSGVNLTPCIAPVEKAPASSTSGTSGAPTTVMKKLKIGSTGKLVRKLQKRLHVRRTGYYGSQTAAAVKRKKLALKFKPANGVASPKFQRLIGL